jgi:Low-density lipoprotein receptor domain class A
MQSSLRSLVLVAVLTACGDDDGSEPVLDGSVPSAPDAGTSNIDAARSPEPDARVDAAVVDTGTVSMTIDATVQEADAAVDPDLALSAALENKLKNECSAVFTAGSWSNEFFAVRDDYERCVASCFVNGSCTDMKSLFCNSTVNPVVQCVGACNAHPADGFLCGDGSRIPHAYVCDLGMSQNCPDNSDEAHCAGDLFTCGSGAKIPRKLVCDLIAICSDDSDETQGCAKVACN